MDNSITNQTTVETLSTAVLQPKPLKGSAKIVYERLKEKYEKKETLFLKELVEMWADHIIPENKEVIIGYWPEGKYMPRTHIKRQWVKENWENSAYAGQAVQWLKYHIGNLVLNGYVVAIPVINFEVSDKQLS